MVLFRLFIYTGKSSKTCKPCISLMTRRLSIDFQLTITIVLLKHCKHKKINFDQQFKKKLKLYLHYMLINLNKNQN